MKDLETTLYECEAELEDISLSAEKISGYIADLLRDRSKLYGRTKVLEQRLEVLNELKEENNKEDK